MKKNLSLLLVLLLVACATGTVYAANPFVDVPQTHWSYDSINKLITEGVLDGYGETFSGEKLLTRYEMARLIAKTVANNKKLTEKQTAIIKKLSKEYGSELDTMGMHLDAMQEQIDRVKFFGLTRIRYDGRVDGNGAGGKTTWTSDYPVDRGLLFQLGFNAKLNENWNAEARLETYMKFFEEQNVGKFDAPYVPTAWITGPVGQGTLTVGKFWNSPGHQLTYDNDTSGAKYNFDLGKIKSMVFLGVPVDRAGTHVIGSEFRYAASPSTNLALVAVSGHKDGYTADNPYFSSYPWGESEWWGMNGNRIAQDPASRTSIEFGVDTKVSPNLILSAAVSQSNAHTYNKAFMYRLDYKGANPSVVNSWGLWGKFARIEPFSTIKPGGGDIDPNVTGVQIGINYTPLKNTAFHAWYMKGKHIAHDAGYDDTVEKSRYEMEFYF